MAWWVSVQWWGDDRQVSQSGKPLCTGASLWAVPKLAMGVCPLEPRHANGDNSSQIATDWLRRCLASTKGERYTSPYGIPC